MAQNACFWPDGSLSDKATPCNPDPNVISACCFSGETCLSNGLCWDPKYNQVLRMSCTDRTWRSRACPQFCLEPRNDLGLPRHCSMDYDFWICGLNTTCPTVGGSNTFRMPAGYVSDGRGFDVNAVLQVGNLTMNTTTISSSTSTTGGSLAAGASSSASSCPTPTTSPAVDADLVSPTTAIAAGVGVGIPLLLALIAMLYLWRSARADAAAARAELVAIAAQQQAAADAKVQRVESSATWTGGYSGGQYPKGFSSPDSHYRTLNTTHEISAIRPMGELPGDDPL